MSNPAINPAKDALLTIISMCRESDSLTTRQMRIYDAALTGIGLNEAQREYEMRFAIQAVRDKIQARRDRQAAEQSGVQ